MRGLCLRERNRRLVLCRRPLAWTRFAVAPGVAILVWTLGPSVRLPESYRDVSVPGCCDDGGFSAMPRNHIDSFLAPRTGYSWLPGSGVLMPRPDSSVVERGPEKAGVGGSIPSLATTFQNLGGAIGATPIIGLPYALQYASADFRMLYAGRAR